MSIEDQKWAPLVRVFELFRTDTWHLRQEMRQKDPREATPADARKVTPAEEEWLAARETDFLEFAERYLEALNTETLKAYDQTVQKALALAGWFGLLFAAFALPLGVMKDATLPLPHDWPWPASFLLAIAVAMLFVSLFGACRVLWRFRLIGDATFWLLDARFPTQLSLRRERIAELIQRIPINKAYVAVKARLYQGAVWSFYLAVCFEILGIAILFASAPAAPFKSDDRAARIAIASTPSLTPTVSPTEVGTTTPTPAATKTRRPTIRPTPRHKPRKTTHRNP